MNLNFDNRFTQELPADALGVEHAHQVRQVFNACWSATPPTPVAQPRLLAYAADVAESMGLSEQDVHSDAFVQVFSGNQLLAGMQPFSTCYGGHQFGHWAGQLGDGRAISLGEVVHEQRRFELQLKGAGPTPYSRHADGRAVLRSSIREFLCSEAMHHLGVPSTRALSLIATGDGVVRDMFYDGNAAVEPGAIVCRVAPSFIRFGHFEIFAQRGDVDTLKQLVQFTMSRDFPELNGDVAAWFKEVCERTAILVNHWLRVGFVHGVMNTDNMSIVGLTIDYGPYGWVDDLDFGWTPNTTDAGGKRYAFGRQAGVARWNLQKLAQALVDIMPSQKALIEGLAHFDATYQHTLEATLANKLGLLDWTAADDALVDDLFQWMQKLEVDYTEFFRRLADVAVNDGDNDALNRIMPAFYDASVLDMTENRALVTQWLDVYQKRIAPQNEPNASRRARMNAFNPRFVLRNYLAQQAIEAAQAGDLSVLHELQSALLTPYDEAAEYQNLYGKRPEWARDKAGCSMLSCSS